MSDQNKIYEEVAINCSQYCPCGRDHSVKNVSNGDDAICESCLNCSHFSEEECHCCLDLYDKIVDKI